MNAGNLRDSNPDISKSKIAVFSLKMSTHLVGKPSCAGTVKERALVSWHVSQYPFAHPCVSEVLYPPDLRCPLPCAQGWH